jgi:hypothetical protein
MLMLVMLMVVVGVLQQLSVSGRSERRREHKYGKHYVPKCGFTAAPDSSAVMFLAFVVAVVVHRSCCDAAAVAAATFSLH